MSDPTQSSLSVARPPIVEALIDVRFAPNASLNYGNIERVFGELAEEYPSRSARRQYQAELVFAAGNEPSATSRVSEPDGLICQSANREWIIQVGADGLTLSRLEPYPGWQSMCSRILDLLRRLGQIAPDLSVVRLAVRYINRIPIRIGDNLSDVFTIAPPIPEGLPRNVSDFLVRLAIPTENPSTTTLLTVFSNQQVAAQPDSHSFTLDIDAFSQFPDGLPLNDVEPRLLELQRIKNQMFQHSLTSQTLARLQ